MRSTVFGAAVGAVSRMHIIYLGTGMLLSKEDFASWREIQDQYDDYTASLGPWCPDEVIEYLASEHPQLNPPAAVQVAALLNSAQQTSFLT